MDSNFLFNGRLLRMWNSGLASDPMCWTQAIMNGTKKGKSFASRHSSSSVSLAHVVENAVFGSGACWWERRHSISLALLDENTFCVSYTSTAVCSGGSH